MSIEIAGITYDQVRYDAEGDGLYLHRGDSATAVDFDASPEGHALRFDEHGDLVGVTILNAGWLLKREGEITRAQRRSTSRRGRGNRTPDARLA